MTAKSEECALVAKHARTYPEQHDQRFWFAQRSGPLPDEDVCGLLSEGRIDALENCGTTACLAGITVLKFAPEGAQVVTHGYTVKLPDGALLNVDDWAGAFLGFSEEIQREIFHVLNDEVAISRLEYMAEHPDASVWELRRAVPRTRHQTP